MENVIEEIAKRNNKPVDEVRRDMQIAIDIAWERNKGSKIQSLFKNKPTPEEFMLKCAMDIIA